MLTRMEAEERLLAVAGELYGGLPADFTPRRTAAEKAARAEGDKELAGAVKGLKRPSVGAWAVNLLVRRESDQIDQVLTLAESLRAAAEALDGAELRALTKQRRQLTSALTTRARQLALEQGTRLTQAVADQVEGTLNAAMLDAGAAEDVRTGLLVTTLSATGLDAQSWESAVALPESLGTRVAPSAQEAPTLHVVPENKALLREAAEEKLAEAEQEVLAAKKAATKAGKAVGDLQGKRFQLSSEIDELQRRIDALEDRIEGLDEDIEVAEQDQEDAHQAVAEAESEREAAQTALHKLG
jgi:outer membrane murein-binding lipoprotein Lpp